MKTRLLKRLRRQAKREYVVFYDEYKAWGYCVGVRFNLRYLHQDNFATLAQAKLWLEEKRRKYILKKVIKMRPKPIKLDI